MTVIPDSIEPVEEWRTWFFKDNALVSHNGVQWKPGEPLRATCSIGERPVWSFKRNGMSIQQAQEHAKWHNTWEQSQAQSSIYGGKTYRTPSYITAPRVEPPVGYGYAVETETHEAPKAGCTCGIYAGCTPADCPSADILGKVKMWGTVVPGERGTRSEYAYPSELHVPAKWAEHPALLAYGVPIVTIADADIAAVTLMPMPPKRGFSKVVAAAVAVNLGAAALNVSLQLFT